MKKILLLFVLFIAVTGVYAQGVFHLLDHDGNYITNGQKLYVYVDDINAAEAVSEEYFIRNNSDEDISVKCVRTVLTEVDGTMNYFCALGTCLAPMTDETPNPYLILANSTVDEAGVFSAHYMPMGQSGETEVSYKFYNVDNENDTLSFTVLFKDEDIAKNSFQVIDHEGGEMAYGANIEVSVDDLNAAETVSPDFFVKNNLDAEVTLKCEKTYLEIVEGTMNYFCVFERCLGPDDYVSSAYVVGGNSQVKPEGVFSSHYMPDGNSGVSKIHYRFFDVNNVYDEVSFTITFDGTTAINELDNTSKISAFPNPATSSVQFSFDNSELNNSRLVIYNAVGKEALSIHADNTDMLNVDISNLPKGVYLYRLEGESKMSKTSKLIIQ